MEQVNQAARTRDTNQFFKPLNNKAMTTTQSLQQLADQCFQQGQPVTTFMRSIYMHEEYAYEREGNDFYYHSQCVNMVSVLSLLGYTVTPFGVAKAQ